MPMAFWAAEPAPVAIARGTTPRIKASDVMIIGRRRSRAASSVASKSPMPLSMRSLANSTIRIAFFAAKPIVVSKPTLK